MAIKRPGTIMASRTCTSGNTTAPKDTGTASRTNSAARSLPRSELQRSSSLFWFAETPKEQDQYDQSSDSSHDRSKGSSRGRVLNSSGKQQIGQNEYRGHPE